MTSAHIVAAAIGIILSFSITILVRTDQLSPIVAARWFLLSLFVLTLSLVPEIVDLVGEYLGIGYPPIIPVLVAIGGALIKILLMDIERQKMQTKIDRLVQKIAIVEHQLHQEQTHSGDVSHKVTHISEKLNKR